MVPAASVINLTKSTSYYWRANATDSSGLNSAWSSIWSFTTVTGPAAPALVSPVNGAANQATSLALNWRQTAGTGTVSYGVQVSTAANFATTFVYQSGLQDTTATVLNMSKGTVYYWRANGTDNTGTGAWSGVWSFTTIGAPSAPVLSSPVNGAGNQATTLGLSWGAAAGATSYGMQVSLVSTFTTTYANQAGLMGTSSTVAGLSHATVYYWRANATDSLGTSPWSSVWSFTTIVAAPATPVQASPANGATVNSAASYTVTWGAASGATTYAMQVSTVSTFATTIANQSGITTTSASIASVAGVSVYYWRVNATNVGGASAWSAAWSFNIKVSTAPVVAMNALKADVKVENGAIVYSLAHSASVNVTLYTMAGRTALTVDRMQSEGRYAIPLKNLGLAEGGYILRFKAGNVDKRLPVLLMR